MLTLKFTNKPEPVCRNLLSQGCVQHLLIDFLRRRVDLWADAPAGQSLLKQGWVHMKYMRVGHGKYGISRTVDIYTPLNRSYLLRSIRINFSELSFGATLLPSITCFLCRRSCETHYFFSRSTSKTLKTSSTAFSFRPTKSPLRNIKSIYMFGKNHLLSHLTRNSHLLHYPVYRTSFLEKSPYCTCLRMYSRPKLPPKIKKLFHKIPFMQSKCW